MAFLSMVSEWFMVVACAAMAGVYFTFSTFVMRSLAALPPAEGIAAMQSINRVILKSLFMPLFFLTTLLAASLALRAGLLWQEPNADLRFAAGIIYFVGMFVCTAARNVPLNNRLDAVEPTSADAEPVWAHYLDRWTLWNHVRVVSCLAASALFLAAIL